MRLKGDYSGRISSTQGTTTTFTKILYFEPTSDYETQLDLYLCKDYPRIGDSWHFKSDEHTSDKARNFGQYLTCIHVENKGKLVDEAQDLKKKNREVWVVEATYEARINESTPEVNVTDLVAHLDIYERAALPWIVGRLQPVVNNSFQENEDKVTECGKYAFSYFSDQPLSPAAIFATWANDGYHLSSGTVSNSLGTPYNVSVTKFLSTIHIEFDHYAKLLFSNVTGALTSNARASNVSIVNAYTINNHYLPGTIMLKPWRIETKYFYKTWSEEEWPYYANRTTVTPYYHYSLDLVYNPASWGFGFRNEDTKAIHQNAFLSSMPMKAEPLIPVAIDLEGVSGTWTSPSGAASSLYAGNWLMTHSEYTYCDTLYNKSTVAQDYGVTAVKGTANGLVLDKPVPLTLDSDICFDAYNDLPKSAGYYYFMPYTAVDLITLFSNFGYTSDFVINKLLLF